MLLHCAVRLVSTVMDEDSPCVLTGEMTPARCFERQGGRGVLAGKLLQKI